MHSRYTTPLNLDASSKPTRMRRLSDLLSRWTPHDLLAMGARVSLAAVFFRSGRTKVEGLISVTDGAIALFEDEYRLPWIPADVAAHCAAYLELVLPVLLVVGLATRLSAAGLLAMTLVIQFLVYPGAWPTHLTWATLMLYLVGRGGGRWSIDGWLSTRGAGVPHPHRGVDRF